MPQFLKTERLRLRPPEARDVASFAVLLFDYDVSKNLASAPHPYWIADAQKLIAEAAAKRDAGEAHIFAIARKEDGYAMGVIGIGRKDGACSLGYWLGKCYWGYGFATEAGRAMVPLGFDMFRPDAIVADHFLDNPASGRVLTKLGFLPTGAIKDRVSKARGCAAPSALYVLTVSRFAAEYRRP